MNYANQTKTSAQKLTVGVLAFVITAVVISATVIGMTNPDQSQALALAAAPRVSSGA